MAEYLTLSLSSGGDVKIKSQPGAGTSVICQLPETAHPKSARTELELGPENAGIVFSPELQ